MLNLMGSEYIVDHVVLEHNNKVKELLYKSYICDVTKCIAESLSVSISERYLDLISETKVDKRSADEIAIDVINRAGLRSKHNGFIETESDIRA